MGNPLHLTRQRPSAPHPLNDSSRPTGGVNHPYPSPHNNHQPTAALSVHTSAPGGPQVRTITANQLWLHHPHAGSRRLSSENYHRQPAAAPPTTRRLQATLHSSCAIKHLLEVRVPQSPWGGFSSNLASGGDPLLLLPLQLFTSHVGRHSTQEQAVVRSFTTHTKQREREREREREVSRVNQLIHKHTTISIISQCILL